MAYKHHSFWYFKAYDSIINVYLTLINAYKVNGTKQQLHFALYYEKNSTRLTRTNGPCYLRKILHKYKDRNVVEMLDNCHISIYMYYIYSIFSIVIHHSSLNIKNRPYGNLRITSRSAVECQIVKHDVRTSFDTYTLDTTDKLDALLAFS